MDNLGGALLCAIFGIGWLVNLGLNIKMYGAITLLGVGVTRERQPHVYWLFMCLYASLGVGTIGIAVYLTGRGMGAWS